jgi:hypothetical protein
MCVKTIFIPTVLLLALSLPVLAGNNQGQNNNNQGQNNNNQGGGYQGAPAPIVAAGLPVLLIGGGILYWIVRRRKRA